jgi:hypothetical protein
MVKGSAAATSAVEPVEVRIEVLVVELGLSCGTGIFDFLFSK